MKTSHFLTAVLLIIIISASNSQPDTLKLEFGFRVGTSDFVDPPNTVDGWGSVAGGTYGEDLVFHFAEINDSYNGSLDGSEWISFGSMMSVQNYPYLESSIGFYPDTIRYRFLNSTELDIHFSDSQGSYYLIEANYEVFPGTGTLGIDSMSVVSSSSLIFLHIVQINNGPIISSVNDKTLHPCKVFFYPNPAKNVINIDAQENFSVSLIGTDGQVLISDCHDISLDISHLPAGLYFIELNNNEKIVRDIIIKL